MKYGIVALAALALAGCGASPEEQSESLDRVQSKLPDGCTVGYAGDVSVAGSTRESRVFYVVCGKTVTVSETHTEQEGKNNFEQTDVVVSQLD